MKKGILYGVGIGPGDSELITVKAINIISNCEYIATPQTAPLREPQADGSRHPFHTYSMKQAIEETLKSCDRVKIMLKNT